MAQTFTKALLSGSTNGRSIKIVPTVVGSAATIHTSVSGTTSFDEIYIYAYNHHTIPVDLTICFGGTSVPDDYQTITIPNKAGRYLVIDGRLLQNSLIVKAFASVANVVTLDGFVNKIV